MIDFVLDATLTNELEKVNQEFNLDYHTRQWMERCEETNGTEAVDNIQVYLTDLFATYFIPPHALHFFLRASFATSFVIYDS